jgi:NAD(P)-dependent dehydrogenase (short-subunit alcohol dehydrogenase family)
MLFTVSLAQKLGKRGLTAISLHPGVIGTNLSKHIDWAKEFGDLGKFAREFYMSDASLLIT